MNNKYKIYMFSFFLAVGSTINSSVAYCENSVNYFKNVASEAKQIRNQYKERQEYLQVKQYLEDVKNTIQSIKEAFINNEKIEADINKSKNEILIQQRENINWFAQNKDLIAYRAPLLQTMNEHAERMQYLDKEISGCEALIAEQTQKVEYYHQQINTLKAGLINGSERYVYGSASFEDKKDAVLKALKYIKHEESRLDEADIIKNNLLQGKNTANIVYDESIIKHNDALWQKINIWQDGADRTNAILQQYYTLRQELYLIREHVKAEYALQHELENLGSWKKELDKYNIELKKELEEAEKGKQKIESYLAHQHYGRYISTGMEYYSYKGDGGYKGHQLYMPTSYFQEHGYREYGLAVAYVNSSANFGAASESLDGMTDISLHYGVRNANDRYTVRYTMDVDLPIGESKIGKSLLSDDFVPVTRLNEGLNIRPGVEVTRKDGDENVWQAALAYTIKGSYDYSKTKPEASANPGDTLDGRLSWTHAEKNYQMRFAVETFFNSETTFKRDNIPSYREGREMLYKAMYNKRLSKASELMGYFWLRSKGANSNSAGSSSTVRYYGLEYKYSVDENRAWFVRNNNMLSTGNYYDPLNNNYEVDGRNKHTLGVGYEINMQEQGRLTIDANYYWLRDKNPRKKYKGIEFAVWFYKVI